MSPVTAVVAVPGELILSEPLARGARGKRARFAQEWLGLNEFNVKIDGDFGPATEQAVRAFQRASRLPATGVVNQETMDALSAPIHRALAPITVTGDLGTLVVAYARQHLEQRPREIGGPNGGPWVRLYVDGNEGSAWPWCAGFVSFILKQAAATLGVRPPLAPTYSCDLLAADAQKRGLFLPERTVAAGDPARLLRPGTVFLQRRAPGDWAHTGLVTAAHADTYETIEGNTNDSGDREGYEVCKRFRAYRGYDFARLSA